MNFYFGIGGVVTFKNASELLLGQNDDWQTHSRFQMNNNKFYNNTFVTPFVVDNHHVPLCTVPTAVLGNHSFQ